jgi:hypothetical protein
MSAPRASARRRRNGDRRARRQRRAAARPVGAARPLAGSRAQQPDRPRRDRQRRRVGRRLRPAGAAAVDREALGLTEAQAAAAFQAAALREWNAWAYSQEADLQRT